MEKKNLSKATSFRLRSQSLNTVRLRRIFDACDSNGDGEISMEELAAALRRLGMSADAEELRLTVADLAPEACGQGCHGGLDFSAFSSVHRVLGERIFGEGEEGEGGTLEEDLWEAFRVFDEDGDGFISVAELRSVLSRLGLLQENSDVAGMICGADVNDDGLVDFSEFKVLIRQGISVFS